MSPVQSSKPQAQKRSGVIIPHAPEWYQRLGAFVIFLSLRALLLTVRCRMRARSEYFSAGAPAPVIFCIWHNRLATCVKVLDRHRRPHNAGAGMAALVSASKDGAFLAHILELFRIQPVRGSSSRRGAQALLELVSWAERGHDLTITPDGPRGPCYRVQEGIASLAQVTGLPIVPVTMNLNWKIRIKSWDQFQIPLPFARCEVCVGRAIRVPPDVTDDERRQIRQQLEAELRALTRD